MERSIKNHDEALKRSRQAMHRVLDAVGHVDIDTLKKLISEHDAAWRDVQAASREISAKLYN